MVISFLMVILAGGLWFKNEVENSELEELSYEVVSDMEEVFDEYIANKDNENYERIDKIEHKGTTYIGVLTIPSLNNMSLGVIDKFSMDNLKVSVCRYSGGIGQDNMVIAGHNYKYSFGQLYKLNIGAKAYFKTMDGTLYEYRCTKIEELLPTDVEKMKNGDWDMTLYTCTFGAQKRLTLRFELENKMKI